ncbi:hypothetical protein B296_00039810 [Ensete ventricosum]|uniref:Uncharacterized protein n=1 Tax=Ensete ventricosum TaxID=4639 RepID=A0A426ZCN5_ENSVE|nr:hypothetical protein B296_00039810 [Ensete ventricosum]
MVVALGPGRFYGSSLPRPRFYADVKFNDERVDPLVPVMDPFLSWAKEAHWSMGGVNFNRHRLQGRIEGSIKKLREQQEKTQRTTPVPSVRPKPMISKPRVSGRKPLHLAPPDSVSSGGDDDEEVVASGQGKSEFRVSSSPCRSGDSKRKRVRRLGEEFDRIAAEQLKGHPREDAGGVASRTRRRRSVAEEVEVDEREATCAAPNRKLSNQVEGKKRKEVDGGVPRRTSPRKKQQSS